MDRAVRRLALGREMTHLGLNFAVHVQKFPSSQ